MNKEELHKEIMLFLGKDFEEIFRRIGALENEIQKLKVKE